MKRATITEAKNGLSALIDQVKAGESILITDRGVPVAYLSPPAPVEDDEDRIARLERAGIAHRGPGRGDPRWILERPPTPTLDGRPVSDLVIEDREAGW
jgi:prevent-host-death family protein